MSAGDRTNDNALMTTIPTRQSERKGNRRGSEDKNPGSPALRRSLLLLPPSMMSIRITGQRTAQFHATPHMDVIVLRPCARQTSNSATLRQEEYLPVRPRCPIPACARKPPLGRAGSYASKSGLGNEAGLRKPAVQPRSERNSKRAGKKA